MLKYDLTDIRLIAQNEVFKKLLLLDFCDLYLLDKQSLTVENIQRVSSDFEQIYRYDLSETGE